MRRAAFPLPTSAPAEGRAAPAGPAGPAKPLPVRRMPLNERGRDFVVGDIHGCFDEVLAALKAVGFDRARDRLFSVGDTVDRGPGSPRARRFLSQPWVHAVRGNHEDMFLELYAQGEPHPVALEFATARNGMGWWMDLPVESRRGMIESFRQLPVAIEVETRRGTVGLVHAEVPAGLTWQDFLARVEAGDRKVVEACLWGRGRVGHQDDAGVVGVGRLFVGHTPQERPVRLGNVYYVDTGCVFGVLDRDPGKGRMTVADLACATAVLHRAPDGSIVDVRIDEDGPADGPFGAYARPR